MRAAAQEVQELVRVVAEAEARFLGASAVVWAAWRILSTPMCARRWRSSAACAAGRRATWEVAPTRWNPRARLVATEAAADGVGGAGSGSGGAARVGSGSGGAARGWGGAVGAFGGEKPGEGAVGGEGGEGDATRPNPGGRSAMEGDSVEVGEAGKVVEVLWRRE